MTTRILPQDEWIRLAGTEAADVWPHLDPMRSHVVVVEEAGEIIACHVLMQVLHAECLWVHPDHRRPDVSRLLWAAVQEKARLLGAKSLATAATTERVKRLLAYVGGKKLDGEHYVIPMEAPCRPQ
jgi:N-acetylglutamate synthase-like GNAT family acetyltransferase